MVEVLLGGLDGEKAGLGRLARGEFSPRKLAVRPQETSRGDDRSYQVQLFGTQSHAHTLHSIYGIDSSPLFPSWWTCE